jgi:hypothetical protein
LGESWFFVIGVQPPWAAKQPVITAARRKNNPGPMLTILVRVKASVASQKLYARHEVAETPQAMPQREAIRASGMNG